jgi:hypothetical protein
MTKEELKEELKEYLKEYLKINIAFKECYYTFLRVIEYGVSI